MTVNSGITKVGEPATAAACGVHAGNMHNKGSKHVAVAFGLAARQLLGTIFVLLLRCLFPICVWRGSRIMRDESNSGTGISDEAPFSAEQLAMINRLIVAQVAAPSAPTLDGELSSSATPPSSTSGKTHFFRHHWGLDSNYQREPTACRSTRLIPWHSSSLKHRVTPVALFLPRWGCLIYRPARVMRAAILATLSDECMGDPPLLILL